MRTAAATAAAAHMAGCKPRAGVPCVGLPVAARTLNLGSRPQPSMEGSVQVHSTGWPLCKILLGFKATAERKAGSLGATLR